MVGKYKKNKYGLYVLSKENIDNEAENILRQYCEECLYEPQRIDIEKLIEDMGINLCYANLSKNSEILGAFVFNSGNLPTYVDNQLILKSFTEKTIVIDSQIADNDDARLKFTYGHELGHFVTQYDLFHISSNQLSLFDDNVLDNSAVVCKRETIIQQCMLTKHKMLETKEDWQEWQANYFSSCILIPACTLKITLKPYLDNFDIMSQEKVLDKVENNEYQSLIEKLCVIFDVSKEMMVNRLKSLNYLS